MDGLVKGSVDIGLLRPIVGRPGVVSRPLMRDRLVVALPEGSSLLGNMAAPPGEPLPLGSLDRLPLLMYSTKEARYFHDLVLRLFASAGAHANVTQYASQAASPPSSRPTGGDACPRFGHGVRSHRRGIPRN